MNDKECITMLDVKGFCKRGWSSLGGSMYVDHVKSLCLNYSAFRYVVSI